MGKAGRSHHAIVISYCKFGFFARILLSQIALKDILETLKKIIYPSSINDKVISSFREGFIFVKF